MSRQVADTYLGWNRDGAVDLWRQLARSLGVVVNSLLPVSLLPEWPTLRASLPLDEVGFDRWAHVHFG